MHPTPLEQAGILISLLWLWVKKKPPNGDHSGRVYVLLLPIVLFGYPFLPEPSNYVYQTASIAPLEGAGICRIFIHKLWTYLSSDDKKKARPEYDFLLHGSVSTVSKG